MSSLYERGAFSVKNGTYRNGKGLDLGPEPTRKRLGKALPKRYDVIKIQEAGPISLPGFFLNSPPPPNISLISHTRTC